MSGSYLGVTVLSAKLESAMRQTRVLVANKGWQLGGALHRTVARKTISVRASGQLCRSCCWIAGERGLQQCVREETRDQWWAEARHARTAAGRRLRTAEWLRSSLPAVARA